MDYLYYKLIHLIAIVFYLGNIISGLFWMRFANKTKNLEVIRHTIQGISLADRYFAMPGVLIITIFGLLAAIYGHIPIMGSGWIAWSITVFILSGIAFMGRVVPLQKKIKNLVMNTKTPSDLNWEKYMGLIKHWNAWVLIAFLLSFSAFVMMVLKIPK
jgi:uncharacterized membrane protein